MYAYYHSQHYIGFEDDIECEWVCGCEGVCVRVCCIVVVRLGLRACMCISALHRRG